MYALVQKNQNPPRTNGNPNSDDDIASNDTSSQVAVITNGNIAPNDAITDTNIFADLCILTYHRFRQGRIFTNLWSICNKYFLL